MHSLVQSAVRKNKRGFAASPSPVMSTRSAAAASSSKRKRPSASASPAESPAKRRSTRGSGGASAETTVADPPTLVPVAPPEEGWSGTLRRAREDGKFIDITLLVDGRKIPAHKLVIVSHSPYLDGLLTSGLAEVKAPRPARARANHRAESSLSP
jgi:hypothetical protein